MCLFLRRDVDHDSLRNRVCRRCPCSNGSTSASSPGSESTRDCPAQPSSPVGCGTGPKLNDLRAGDEAGPGDGGLGKAGRSGKQMIPPGTVTGLTADGPIAARCRGRPEICPEVGQMAREAALQFGFAHAPSQEVFVCDRVSAVAGCHVPRRLRRAFQVKR